MPCPAAAIVASHSATRIAPGAICLLNGCASSPLHVTIDAIGNIIGVRSGRADTAAVMFGSHVDTVATGGRFDGLYGVLAGLEACEALNDVGYVTRRPLALVAFTNEEGSRFPPYAMGSLVYVGGLALADAYAIRGIDGRSVGEELKRIGYAASAQPGWLRPHAYLELHIEQGPILEDENRAIGAVEGITGLTWTEVTVTGCSGHAGTTPMHLRHDAALVSGEIIALVHRLAQKIGGHQKATVGRIELYPNLVNVIAERAVLTIDLRNTDQSQLEAAERELTGSLARLARDGGVSISTRSLARFEPVAFPAEIVSLVETTARDLALPSRRLPSGAGHDAQMMARICPSGMIFVPSVGGLSHRHSVQNIIPDGREYGPSSARRARRTAGGARAGRRAVVSTSETISAGNATGSKRARLQWTAPIAGEPSKRAGKLPLRGLELRLIVRSMVNTARSAIAHKGTGIRARCGRPWPLMAADLLCQAMHQRDDLARDQRRIVPQMHRRRAGIARRPVTAGTSVRSAR